MVHGLTTRSDRGAVMVVVSLMMFVIIGVVAVVVDVGLARQQNAQAQAAADSAALAGARELNIGDSVGAQTIAAAVAADNGFPSGTTVVTPPTSGTRVGDPICIEVTTSGTVDTTFGRFLGRDDIAVGARAVACGRGGGSVPAIFAASETCNDKTLKFSGSSSEVLGGVHSNDEIQLSGSSNNFFSGDFSRVSVLDHSGSGNAFDPGNPQTSAVQPLPVEFDIDDYMPGGIRANEAAAAGMYHNAGSNKIDMGWLESNTTYNSSTGEMEPGLYYTSDEIDLSASDLWVGDDGVTFVSSDGVIKLAGSDHDLTPWDSDHLLAFSDYMKSSPLTNNDNCDGLAVQMSGSSTQWAGIVFAPRGRASLNGSVNTTLAGSIIALTVEVSGSTLSIDSGGLSTLDNRPKLVE